MANECLVTKLKRVVENDELPILGQLKIKVLDTTSIPSDIVVGSTYHLSSDNQYLIVDDKYSMTKIRAWQGTRWIELNCDDLKYCTSLCEIACINQKVIGDVSNLPNSIINLALGQSTINIVNIAHLINLIELTQTTNNNNFICTGALEDFIAGQISNGRTSCDGFYIGSKITPSLKVTPTQITYQGSTLTGRTKKVTWNWDGSSANISVVDYYN